MTRSSGMPFLAVVATPTPVASARDVLLTADTIVRGLTFQRGPRGALRTACGVARKPGV